MPHIKPEVEAFARIKVVGVGGSGKHAVNHMINSKVKGVEYIAINSDAQDLHHALPKKKIHIGKNITRGLGTGMNPELGRKAAEETAEEIQESIKGADMVFIACGFGGGSGSGASGRIARSSREMGALTVAVITKPFFFEGAQRKEIAEGALEEIRKHVDAIIVIPNDRLFSAVDKDTPAKRAFAMSDEVLKQAVEGISDLITTPGEVANVDFADIKAIMSDAGSALMGIGYADGEKRAEEAAKQAIESPLLDISITGAKGVLFSIAGGDDLTMMEIQNAANVITESVDQNAKIIFGTVRDDKLKKGEVKITVIATGFPDEQLASSTTLFRESAPAQEENKKEQSTTDDSSENERGRIYNEPIRSRRSEKQQNTSETPKKQAGSTTDEDDDDDDWGAVPAFLRRSRLK